jgi:diguanylate cyclase (GGDEF)-like protein
MGISVHGLRDRGRGPGRLRLFALLAGGLLVFARAQAGCIDLSFPDLAALGTLEYVDASRALARAQALIRAAQNDPGTAPLHLAALYAIAAESSSILELDADARQAALRGLQLATPNDNPVYLSLLISYAETVYDTPGLQAQVDKLATIASRQPRGSPGSVCLLRTLGWLQHRLNQDDVAVGTLTNAYRDSALPSLARQRARVAEALAMVMDGMGDFDQALDLMQQTLAWEQAHHAVQLLAVTRYLRGAVLLEKGDYPVALAEFDEARRLARELADRQGIAYADLRICEARIRLGQSAVGRPSCEAAQVAFAAAGVKDLVKQARALLAHADLDAGRTAAALATLNEVLDQDGADIVPRSVPPLLELRARANAASGNYLAAYSDLNEYVRRAQAVTDADRARSGSVLRARFRVDSEIERNLSLQRELRLTRESSALQRNQLQIRTEVLVAGVGLMVLLVYVLLANMRHRRQLQRMAREDSLTRLPNRRCTAELATAALAEALGANQPLTIALIDLDHFKLINDACGHAVGDRVLKELATLSRAMLRDGEVLGRWGGEEFLMLLPAQPLDLALARVEALRAAALEIALPENAKAAGLRVSLSAGMATSYEGASSLDEIIARADVALYEAKKQGRNLVRVADESLQASTTAIRRALRKR